MGPRQGEATIYKWKLYDNIPSLMLWVILLAAIVLEKANRNLQALLVFIPLYIIFMLWFGFVYLCDFPASFSVQFDPIIVSYTICIAILWLLAHKFINLKGWITFIFAFGVMAFVGLVGSVSYNGREFSQQNLGVMVLLVILSFAMLSGFILARRKCRNRYNPIRFILWLALWTIASALICILVFYAIIFLLGQIPVNLLVVLLMVFIVGLVIGLVSFLINLPFVILAMNSPFFRERFFAFLHFESVKDSDSDERIINEQRFNL